MHKMRSDELIGTTAYTINRIKKHKNAGDMLILYFSYIEQSRIQETNRSRSLDVFMLIKSGLKKTRFFNAKKNLKLMGLLDVINVRDEKGRIVTWYAKTNFLIDEQKIRTQNITYELDVVQLPVFPVTGETATNALSIKNKCLKNKKKRQASEKEARIVLLSFGLTKSYVEYNFSFKKRLSTLINLCNSVKYISAELDILPIYDVDTINATSIMLSKDLSLEDIIKRCKDNGWDGVENYKELIRSDYYLPAEIEK